MKRQLTIGMSTFDDYDGVYFSVQAIRLYHSEVTADTEVIVVDNNPTGPCSNALKALEDSVVDFRYIPNGGVQSTASKDVVFREARAPNVLCIDSHVMLLPGSLQKLIAYFRKNPTSMNLLQGPLVHDNLIDISAHMDPVWRDGMLGIWASDQADPDESGDAFEIHMQGMGLFACRKDAWLGYNPRFGGFCCEVRIYTRKISTARKAHPLFTISALDS